MSSDTLKKRGRAKKVADPEQEVVVVAQPSIPKPRKSTPKKQTVKVIKEPARPLSEPTEPAETDRALVSQVKRGGNGRKLATTTPANNRAAKQKALSNTESAILQEATAFKSPNGTVTLEHRETSKPDEANQSSIGSPMTSYEVGSNATQAEILEAAQEPTSTTTAETQEAQLDTEGTPSNGSSYEIATPVSSTSAATVVDDRTTTPISQGSQQEPAAPVSNRDPPSLPSGDHGETLGPVGNATAASSSLKPEPSSAPKPMTAPKTIPRVPASFAPPPSSPRPLRPTEMPYHELKKNPEFKALSRKYTSLFIAIPIALYTSYVLYGRYTNQRARKRISDEIPVERRGGAKPRLLVENVADTAMPSKSTAETGNTAGTPYDKRILEE